MTTDKRRRELARAKAERQASVAPRHPRGLAGTGSSVFWLAGAVVTGAVVWAAWPDSTEQAGAKPPRKPRAHPTPDDPPPRPLEATPGPGRDSGRRDVHRAGSARNDGRTWDKPADQNLSGTVDWILNTNCGPDHGRAGRASSTQERQRTGIPHRPGLLLGQLLPPADHCRDLRPAVRLPGADGTGETGFTVPDENLPDEGRQLPGGHRRDGQSGPGHRQQPGLPGVQEDHLASRLHHRREGLRGPGRG